MLFTQRLNHINRWREVNLNGICHYLSIWLPFYYTWTHHRKHYVLRFPVINLMHSVSTLLWAMKVYCIDFSLSFWSHSETLPRIGGQASQDWHQTHPCPAQLFCPPAPISSFYHMVHKQRFLSPTFAWAWANTIINHPQKKKHDFTLITTHSFTTLFRLFSDEFGLSPCDPVNNSMSVCSIQSECVWVRDKDYLSHKVTPSIPPSKAERLLVRLGREPHP